MMVVQSKSNFASFQLASCDIWVTTTIIRARKLPRIFPGGELPLRSPGRILRAWTSRPARAMRMTHATESKPMNPHTTTNVPPPTRFTQNIRLTPVHSEAEGMVTVIASRLITYAEELGFTRLRLLGGHVLEVRETAGQIDRLIRDAYAGPRHAS